MRGRGTSTSYWSSGPPGAAPGFQAKRNSGNLNNFHQQQMQNNSGGSYNYNNYNNLQNMNSAPGGGYNQNNVVGGYQHQGGMGGMGMGHPGSGGQHYPGPGSGSQKSSYFGTSYNQQQQTSSYHQQSSYHPTSSVSYQGHQRTDSYSHNSSGGGYHTTSGGNNPAPGNYHNRTRSWIMTSTTEGEGGQHQKESQLYSSTTSQHGNGSSSGGAAANNRQTGASRRVRGEQHLFVEEAQVVLDLKESRFRARDLERWSDITLTENNLSLDPSSYERVTVNLESNFLGPKGDGVAYFLSKLPLASPSSLVLGTSTSRKSARATVSLAHNGFTTRARDLVLNVIGSGMFVEIDVSHNFFEDDDLIAFVQRAVNCGFYYAGASKNSGASSGGTLLNTPNTNASTNGTPPNVVLDVEQVTGGTRPETSNKNGSTISSATATPGRGVDASDLTTTNPASADESATEQTRGHLTPNKDLQSPTSLTGGTSSEEHGDGILAGTPETSASSNLPDVVEGRTMMAMTAGKSAAGNEDAPTTSTPPPGISTASSGRTLRLRIDSNSPESEVICLQRLRDTFGLQIHLASPSSTIITTTESVSGTATGPTVSDSAVVIIDGRFGQGLPRRPPAMQPESWRASAGSYSGYSSSVHPHSGSAQNGLSSGYSTATGGYNSSSSYGSPGQHHGQQLQHQYQPAGAGVVVQGQQQQHYPGGSQGSAPSSLQGGQQQQQHGPSYGAGSGYHATATPAGYRSDRDMQWRLPPPPPPSGPPPSGPPPPGPPPQQTPMQQAAIQHAPPQLTFTGDDLSRRIAELEANPERRYRGKLKIWNATRQGGAGFVECPAIAGLFDRDVYLKLGTEQGGLTVDDYLEFNIVIVRREEKVRPQARNVVQVAANIPPPPGISAGTMQSYMNSQAQMAGGNAGAVTTGEMIMGVTGSGGTPGAVLPGSSGYQQQQPGVAAAAMHMAGTTPTIPPLSAAASVPPGAAGLANSQQPITPAAGPQRAQMQTPTTADIQTAAMMRYGGSESIDRESLQLDEMLAPGGCSYLLYLPEVDVPRSEFIPLKSNRQPDWLIFDLLDNFLSRHELDQAVQHTMAETLSWPIDKAELVKRAPHLAGKQSADQLWCDPLAYFVSRIDIVKYDFAPELKDRSSVMMWGLLAVTKSLLAFHAFNVPIAYRKFRIAIKLIEAMRLWEPSVQEDRESFIELITSRLNSISAQVMADDQLERLQPIAEYVRARFAEKVEQSGVGGGSAPLLGGSSTSRGADGAAVGNSVAGGGVGVTGGQFFGAGGTRGAAGAVGGSSGALGGSSGAVGGSSAVVGSVVENHSASYLSAAASGSTASAGYEQHTTNYGPRVPSTTTATMAPGQGAVSSSAGVPPSMMPSDAGTSMHAGAYGGGQGVVMTNGASALHHQYPTQQQSTLPPYYSLQPGSSASLSDVYAGGSLTQNDLDPRTMMGWHRREE